MSDHPEEATCDGLLAYLSNPGDGAQRERFERHLRGCTHCRQELAELRTLWQSLPGTAISRIDPPHGLKKQVLRAILGRQGNDRKK